MTAPPPKGTPSGRACGAPDEHASLKQHAHCFRRIVRRLQAPPAHRGTTRARCIQLIDRTRIQDVVSPPRADVRVPCVNCRQNERKRASSKRWLKCEMFPQMFFFPHCIHLAAPRCSPALRCSCVARPTASTALVFVIICLLSGRPAIAPAFHSSARRVFAAQTARHHLR